MKNNNIKASIEEQIKALKAMQDDEIDCSDIPEVNFLNAEQGRFYRPIKQAITLRIDADIVEWFKQHNPRYQTAINKALREYVSTQVN